MGFVGDQGASSSSTSRCPYQVFLSFRGVDTRLTFTGHLYTALMNAGINTFKDDAEMTRGETIKSELERGIQQSRGSIIVFSKDYASSRWCLNELAMILECKRVSEHVVLPIFYHVNPTDVRRQTGSIGKAFAKYEKKVKREGNRETKNKLVQDIKRWRTALKETADISGMELTIEANGNESKFIQKVVTLVQDKLSRKILYVAPYLVGMTSRTRDIDLWIRDPTSDASIMVISGIGGIGKTTIAKCVFNESYRGFDGYSFLSNIRERSKEHKGLINIQKQLLSDVWKRNKEKIYNTDEGIIKIGEAIGCKKVLLVFDDVDHVDQLTAIFRLQDSLYPGSKIIVTTRNKWLINEYGVCKVHNVCTLNHDESVRLFSFHAFQQGPVNELYRKHVKNIVHRCGGLPLALQILGSSLIAAKLDIWAGVSKKLETIPNSDIIKKLMISFDSLPDDDVKNIFLHIACFFTGENKDLTIKILDSCDMHAAVGVNILVNRCLLEIDYFRALTLHPLIIDMGRYIVREESSEPGERSRLWPSQDCFNVLKGKTGTSKVKALGFDMQMGKTNEPLEPIAARTNGKKRYFGEQSVWNNSVKRHASNFHSWQLRGNKEENSNKMDLDTDTFTRMEQLMFLKLNNVELSGSYKEFPQRLRWLRWHGCHFECIPDDLSLSSMVFLDMQYSSLKELWKGSKLLPALNILDLSYSLRLDKGPDFSGLANLEKLILIGCTQLGEISETIEFAKGLVLLDLEDCRRLTKLPRNISRLHSLKKLNISGCSNLEDLPMGLRDMKSIKVFRAERIDMNALVSLGKGITSFSSFPQFVRELSLKNCKLTNESFPDDLSNLSLLKKLNLGGNLITRLPNGCRTLSKLEILRYNNCPQLQSILGLPTTLKYLLSRGFEQYCDRDYGRYIESHDCPKLDEIEGCYKRARGINVDRRIMKTLGLVATLTDLAVFQDIEVRFEYGMFTTWIRGDELNAGWFSHKSKGHMLSFTVPDRPNKIRGLTIGFVYVKGKHFIYPMLTFNNHTRDCKWDYSIEYYQNSTDSMVWLSYLSEFGRSVEAGDKVTISVRCFENGGDVKEIGTRIVYDREDEEEEVYEDDFDNDKKLTTQPLKVIRLSLSDESFIHYSDFPNMESRRWASFVAYHSYESEDECPSSDSSDECRDYDSLVGEPENDISDGCKNGSHNSFVDESENESHSSDEECEVAGASKLEVVGGKKSGTIIPDSLALAILGQQGSSANPSGSTRSTPSKKKVEKNVDHVPLSFRVVPSSVHDSADLISREDKRQGKRALDADRELSKRPRLLPLDGPKLGCDISVGEKEGWFVGENRPMQVFDGFNLLNDADHYVGKSSKFLKRETDVYLARFLSNYVRMRDDFGHGPEAELQDLEKKHNDLKEKCAALEMKEKSWQMTEAALKKRINDLEDEKKKARLEVKRQKKSFDDEHALLKEDLTGRDASISDLQTTITTREGRIEKLEAELVAANAAAADRVQMGYTLCLERLAAVGVDVTGQSWDDFKEDLRKRMQGNTGADDADGDAGTPGEEE